MCIFQNLFEETVHLAEINCFKEFVQLPTEKKEMQFFVCACVCGVSDLKQEKKSEIKHKTQSIIFFIIIFRKKTTTSYKTYELGKMPKFNNTQKQQGNFYIEEKIFFNRFVDELSFRLIITCFVIAAIYSSIELLERKTQTQVEIKTIT
jgi:hypothetical protein